MLAGYSARNEAARQAVFPFLPEGEVEEAPEDGDWELPCRLPEPEFRRLPITAIFADPDQPRQVFEPGSLRRLASSIENIGLLVPLLVEEAGGGYGLLAGERRLRALEICRSRHPDGGFDEVACMVYPPLYRQARLAVQLAENRHRERLRSEEMTRGARDSHLAVGVEAARGLALAAGVGLRDAATFRSLTEEFWYVVGRLRRRGVELPDGLVSLVVASAMPENRPAPAGNDEALRQIATAMRQMGGQSERDRASG